MKLIIQIWRQFKQQKKSSCDPKLNDPAAINHRLPVAAVVALPKERNKRRTERAKGGEEEEEEVNERERERERELKINTAG